MHARPCAPRKFGGCTKQGPGHCNACPKAMRPHLTPSTPSSQVGFKRDLIREVRAFVTDAQAFRREWDAAGPMVPGLDPMEAMDRLRKFQQLFEVRAHPRGGCVHEGGLPSRRTSSQACGQVSERFAAPLREARGPVNSIPPPRSASVSGTATPPASSCLACMSRASPSWSRRKRR
jgi:hypothetical protein